jgi:hypothetical protein
MIDVSREEFPALAKKILRGVSLEVAWRNQLQLWPNGIKVLNIREQYGEDCTVTGPYYKCAYNTEVWMYQSQHG